MVQLLPPNGVGALSSVLVRGVQTYPLDQFAFRLVSDTREPDGRRITWELALEELTLRKTFRVPNDGYWSDVWMQHPTLRHANHEMFESLRRWMGMESGFEEEILNSLESDTGAVRFEAIRAAGIREIADAGTPGSVMLVGRPSAAGVVEGNASP